MQTGMTLSAPPCCTPSTKSFQRAALALLQALIFILSLMGTLFLSHR